MALAQEFNQPIQGVHFGQIRNRSKFVSDAGRTTDGNRLSSRRPRI